MKNLCLLHLSDLHSRDFEIEEYRLRREALVRDLRGLQVSPDIVVVSGDVAFSGHKHEYELAMREFFAPLIDELGLKADQLCICPGNHDIDRSVIDDVVKAGIASRLGDTDTAQSLLAHASWILPQESNFLDFIGELRGARPEVPYGVQRFSIDRTQVGVAVLDSAWLCLDNETEQRIFLTRAQVQSCLSQLEGCDLRVAVVHHPLSWFHPSENEIVQQDLLSGFDMILIGHKHESQSRASSTPSADCLELMSSSFFDGHPEGAPDGYNIYTIDADNRRLDAQYRAFFRNRKAYDRNVEHARDGEHRFALPSTAYANAISTALARRVTEASEAISVHMGAGLRRAQGLDDPIILTPSIEVMEWRDGEKKFTRLDDPFSVAMAGSCIVYGPADAGTTTFLEEVSQRINEDHQRIALYLEYREMGETPSPDQLVKRLAKLSGHSEVELRSVPLTIVLDHVTGADPQVVLDFFTVAQGLADVVLCLKNEILFDTLASSLSSSDLTFLRMRYWGPSRLRQFTKKYIEAVSLPIDTDAAFKFISDSLSLSDLPVSPFLVALYLRVFLEFGGELTSISFVRLLERLEADSLDRADAVSNYSIYNLRLMLMKLAARCHEDGVLTLPRSEYELMIQAYFDERALEVDASRFVSLLEESGILLDDGESVGFSCIVFFNYYLSQAIEQNETDLAAHLGALHTALQLGDALAYYAGRNRDEEALAVELMRCLEEEYTPGDGITAEYLENYIHHLLQPEEDSESKDFVAQEAMDATVDYEEADSAFEHSQKRYRSLAQALMKAAPPRDKVEKVAWNIVALKTFYNVFRNLEHIPAESKIDLLDRILDFHLQCNMDLIDLFSEAMDDDALTSLCAYMVTMGGEVFLSKNVGSASLQRTINDLLDRTTNDLKAFLLHCIYADLHLPDYAGVLEAFLSATSSLALVEMGYFKIYGLMVQCEAEILPTALISAFNSVFEKRQSNYGRVSPMDLQRMRDKALNDVKRQHLVSRKDRSVK